MSDEEAPLTSGSPDDRRQASSLTISLSGYVMTATLAVLGAQAVLVTFVIDNRTPPLRFYIASVLAIVCLIASFVCGGRGIDELIRAGVEGKWKTRTKNELFNWQALLALAGTVLVVVSALLGDA